MKTVFSIIFAIALLCCTKPALSQSAYPSDEVVASLPEIPRTMRFDGVIKTKLETSVKSGYMRFNVRNSRIGVRGDIGEYLAYRVQVELSNEGILQPLDLFGTLKPANNLRFIFGQQNIPFDNIYVIGPGDMMFANRTFVGKFFTPGSRDMGAVAQYRFSLRNFPMEGQAGIFNGGVINEPQWTKKPSYAFRLLAGNMTGFRTTAKAYKYNRESLGNNTKLDYFFWGIDARYADSKLCIETELMKRRSLTDDLDLLGGYIQGAYTFVLRNTDAMFRTLTPAMRFDAMGYNAWNKGFEVKRLTAGVMFGLTFLPFDTLLRIDYEQYFVDDNLQFPDFRPGRDDYVTDNKATVELLVRF